MYHIKQHCIKWFNMSLNHTTGNCRIWYCIVSFGIILLRYTCNKVSLNTFLYFTVTPTNKIGYYNKKKNPQNFTGNSNVIFICT